MKIALVTNVLPPQGRGGAELYVAALGAALSRRGHDVGVISGSAGVVPGVTVSRLPRRPDVPRDAGTVRKAVWHLTDLWRLEVHRDLRALLGAGGYDVVHTNSPQGLSSAVYSAVRAAGVPHVHMAHDYNALCMRTSMTRGGAFCGGRCLSCRPQRVVRGGLLRRSVDVLVTATDYVRERHVEAGVAPAADAVTIPYGVGEGWRRLRNLDDGHDPRLGYIGTLGAHKGVDVLLEAFARAPASWRMAIAGVGPMEAQVRAAAAADGRIALHGFVTGEDKERFFDGLDLLLVPSVWEEPAGIVALEATIRGLPFVVTDRGGLAATPGAEVVAAGEPRALLDGIQRLLAGDALRTRSAQLLEEVEPPTLKRNVDAVERVLAEVAGRRQPRAVSSA